MASCDHVKVIREISKANEVMTQLRALLLPLTPIDQQTVLARDLFEESLQSLTAALTLLGSVSFNGVARPNINTLIHDSGNLGDDHKRILVLGNNKVNQIKPKRGVPKIEDSRKRRRCSVNLEERWTSVTSVPHVDGHQWRKYGQKQIGKHKFLRNYYRCTHHSDQKCLARKTIQEQGGQHDPSQYTVCYINKHSCKNTDTTNSVLLFTPIMEYSSDIKSEPNSNIAMEAAELEADAISREINDNSSSVDDNELIRLINGGGVDSFNWEEMMFTHDVIEYQSGSWEGDMGSDATYDESIWNY